MELATTPYILAQPAYPFGNHYYAPVASAPALRLFGDLVHSKRANALFRCSFSQQLLQNLDRATDAQ